MNRAVWLDIAKGLGILLVILTHVLVGIHDASLAISSRIYEVTYNVLFSIHMPLFFFISGLSLLPSLSKITWPEFILKKANRILYPYVLWILVQGTIMALFSGYTNNPHNFGFLGRLFFGHVGHFWFLHAIFLILFFVSIPFKLFSVKPMLIALSLFSIGWYLLCYFNNNAFNPNDIAQYLVYFVLGILINQSPYLNKSKLKQLIPILLPASFIVFCGFEVWLLSIYPDYPHYFHPIALITSIMAIATFSGISIFLSQFRQQPIIKGLKYLGERTLYIYLLHVLAIAGTRIFLLKLFGVESVEIHLIVQMVMGVALPVLFYEVTQKYGLSIFFRFPNLMHQVKIIKANS